QAKGFSGVPAPAKLDGYEAVQTGTTIYAAAGNLAKDAQDKNVLYSNIYVISYNEDAGPQAKMIFDQILKNFKLNASVCPAGSTDCITDLQLCKDTNPAGFSKNSKNNYIGCTTDVGCLEVCQKGYCSITGSACDETKPCAASTKNPFCDAEKTKLQRDVKRLTDIIQMQSVLDAYGGTHGHCSISKNKTCVTNADCSGTEKCLNGYPTIQTGTFIPSMTNSLWPSWQSALGNAIGSALPKDPLNQFGNQCKAPIDTIDAEKNNYDASSCWNGKAGTFVCPADSHLYAYQNQGGENFTLFTQLEFAKAPWATPIDVTNTDYATIQALYPEPVAANISQKWNVGSGFIKDINAGSFSCDNKTL
ncbi:MAG: hypothetical protein AAB664_01335, partial [Patescibacteria group bacterium]